MIFKKNVKNYITDQRAASLLATMMLHTAL